MKLLAENYAAKCIWNHNPDLLDIGENLFVTSGPLDLREALEKWFLGESVQQLLLVIGTKRQNRWLSVEERAEMFVSGVGGDTNVRHSSCVCWTSGE